MFAKKEQRKDKGKSNLLSFIIKDPEYYNFEETVFNIFAFITSLVAILLAFSLPFAGLKFFHILLVCILGVITFILYYLSRFKHKTYPVILIILLDIFLSILWFTGVGSEGFAGLFFITGIMLSITLLKGIKRYVFFFLNPAIIIALIGIEYYHPEWVGTYNSLVEKYVDYLLNVIFLLVGVGFFIKLLVDALRERGKQLEEANKKLQKSAYYDQLTEVPNRRLFYENLNHTLNLARRNEQKFALLYLDLDNFKEINDKLGHDKGDIFLKNAAKTISGCLRKSDILARMGGDEFAIILPETKSEKDVSIVTQKIIDEISTGSDLERYGTSIGVSIGISIFQNEDIGANDLIKQADKAMYRAKNSGKNKYEFYRVKEQTKAN
ncbi:MAG: GGDEF domain-containing protein [Candidatus Caldatribacteriota bacterium]|nr:GGDEF domain-containing protein [Candidatus Caldatribacteriota bacterium]